MIHIAISSRRLLIEETSDVLNFCLQSNKLPSSLVHSFIHSLDWYLTWLLRSCLLLLLLHRDRLLLLHQGVWSNSINKTLFSFSSKLLTTFDLVAKYIILCFQSSSNVPIRYKCRTAQIDNESYFMARHYNITLYSFGFWITFLVSPFPTQESSICHMEGSLLSCVVLDINTKPQLQGWLRSPCCSLFLRHLLGKAILCLLSCLYISRLFFKWMCAHNSALCLASKLAYSLQVFGTDVMVTVAKSFDAPIKGISRLCILIYWRLLTELVECIVVCSFAYNLI